MNSSRQSTRTHLETIRTLAGEGRFQLYRLLAQRRAFLIAKLLFTSFGHLFGSSRKIAAPTVAFAKGANQIRHHNKVAPMIRDEFGPVELRVFARRRFDHALAAPWPCISAVAFVCQVWLLLLLLLSGRRRYVNLYLLSFQRAIEDSIRLNCEKIANFICYNDQPYDVAAIILALRRHTTAKAVVVQHGLILNESFYFPTNAGEFWAWGQLAATHFRARDPRTRFVVKGRYPEDRKNVSPELQLPTSARHVKILVAPSHLHSEAKALLTQLKSILSRIPDTHSINVSVKLHPATKFGILLKLRCRSIIRTVRFEKEDMDILARRFEALVTKNSTSAVDFLLLGRPVFFAELGDDDSFPSRWYGFSMDEIPEVLGSNSAHSRRLDMESCRLKFLQDALNI